MQSTRMKKKKRKETDEKEKKEEAGKNVVKHESGITSKEIVIEDIKKESEGKVEEGKQKGKAKEGKKKDEDKYNKCEKKRKENLRGITKTKILVS